MEPVFNPFDVLSLFAEFVVGQLGFQVVVVIVGRRGVEVIGARVILDYFLQ
jgi:hypothetical protein